MLRLHTGDIVKCFKRDEQKHKGTFMYLYEILNMDVLDTETERIMVVYKALYAPYTVFCRPQDMFLGEVDKVKYPNATQKYRMEKCNG